MSKYLAWVQRVADSTITVASPVFLDELTVTFWQSALQGSLQEGEIVLVQEYPDGAALPANWPAPASLTGAPGAAGADFHFGSGIPDPNLGKNGDWYVRFAVGQEGEQGHGGMWEKAAGTWVFLGNMRGPAGPAGPQGPAGPAGSGGTSEAFTSFDGFGQTAGTHTLTRFQRFVTGKQGWGFNLPPPTDHQQGDWFVFRSFSGAFTVHGNGVPALLLNTSSGSQTTMTVPDNGSLCLMRVGAYWWGW